MTPQQRFMDDFTRQYPGSMTGQAAQAWQERETADKKRQQMDEEKGRFQKLLEGLQTPLDHFKLAMTDLNRWWGKGMITRKEAEAGAALARKDAFGAAPDKTPLVRAGSGEDLASSAANFGKKLGGGDGMPELAKTQAEAAQNTASNTKTIAERVQDLVNVMAQVVNVNFN